MQQRSEVPSGRTVRHLGLALLLAAVAAPAPAEGAPKRRPDLIPSPAAGAPAGVRPGAAFSVTVTVRNAGTGRVPRTSVAFLLSLDSRRDARDVPLRGAASIRPLVRGKKSRGPARLTTPSNLAPGAYHLLACADGRKKVKEKNERNNCAASRSRIAVAVPSPGGGGSPDTPGGGGSPDTPGGGGGPTPPPPADPLGARTVDPDVARANAAIGAFGVDGGTLRHQADDGSVYTLELPPGAVAEPISIKMVPLQGVGRLPFAEQRVAGVQLEPRGLVLHQGGTLTIEPATPIPLSEQTPFAYQGARSELNLEPPLPQAKLAVSVVKLGGFGVGVATAAEREDQLRYVPSAPEDALLQRLSEPWRAVRLSGSPLRLAGSSEDRLRSLPAGALTDPLDQIGSTLSAERAAVASDLLAAQTDASLAPGALTRYLQLVRQMQLTGLRDDGTAVEDARMHELMVKVLLNHLFTAVDRCLALRDPAAALVAMADLRALALLGDTEAMLDDVASQVYEPMRRCFRFELDFDTSLFFDTESHGRAFLLHARFTGLLIRLGPNLESAVEAKPLQYDVTSLKPHCTGDGSATLPFRLIALKLVGNTPAALLDSDYRRLRIEADIGETADLLECRDTCDDFECDVEFQFPSPGRGAASGTRASAYVERFTTQAFTLDRKIGNLEEEILGIEDFASTCGGAPVWLRLIDEPRHCTFRRWKIDAVRGDTFGTWHDETETGETTLRLHHKPLPTGPLED